ncbi:hypothetical protein OXYTRIMIC_394 [Oxytricha trifallax]|uniref:Uncharacterized protein n=1 Tax=Oxytricha trifallax TaxID=1172189 RepID=A0A073HYK6_9SPIT|nr:hypothetical protein OXYTRIMIC_394 [Oxytricha trifallax]
MSDSSESMYDSDDSRYQQKLSSTKSMLSAQSKSSVDTNKRAQKHLSKEQLNKIKKTHSEFKQYYDQPDVKTPCSQSKLTLGLITNNYQKTYKDIQDHPKLSEYPLNALDRELIKNYIRVKRQSLRRALGGMRIKEDTQLQKRGSALEASAKKSKSFQKSRSKFSSDTPQQASIAINDTSRISIFLIQHFSELDQGFQLNVIQKLYQSLIQDKDFYADSIDTQLKHQQNHIIKLFQTREIQQIEKELKNYSQSQVLKFHLAASVIITELPLEGQTLIHTLYPNLKHSVDIQIFDEAERIVLGTMASSINRHLKDSSQPITMRLVGLLLQLNSLSSLKLTTSPESIDIFLQFLVKNGFSEKEGRLSLKTKKIFYLMISYQQLKRSTNCTDKI